MVANAILGFTITLAITLAITPAATLRQRCEGFGSWIDSARSLSARVTYGRSHLPGATILNSLDESFYAEGLTPAIGRLAVEHGSYVEGKDVGCRVPQSDF